MDVYYYCCDRCMTIESTGDDSMLDMYDMETAESYRRTYAAAVEVATADNRHLVPTDEPAYEGVADCWFCDEPTYSPLKMWAVYS